MRRISLLFVSIPPCSAFRLRTPVRSTPSPVLTRRPFLLRRIKSDVETSLPAKTELVLYAPMSDKQRELNDQLRDKTLMVSSDVLIIAGSVRVVRRCSRAAAAASRSNSGVFEFSSRKNQLAHAGAQPLVDSQLTLISLLSHFSIRSPKINIQAVMAKLGRATGRGGSTTALNNVLMQMRKVANHPDLITSAFDDSPFFPTPAQMVEQCGKMALMDRLLTKLRAGGHKVLIFSQMTKMLDLVDAYLDQLGVQACRIDGNISWQDRQAAMKRFNTDPDVFAFLLSTRAGGLGE